MDSLKVKYKVSHNIQALREARGETQAELALAIGVSNKAISNYETGERTPKLEHLIAIANHYGVSIGRFLSSDIEILDKIQQGYSLEEVIGIAEVMLPVFDKQDPEDLDFERGLKQHRKILEQLRTKGYVYGFDTQSGCCMDSYSKSLERTESPECIANILALLFLLWDSTSEQSLDAAKNHEDAGLISFPPEIKRLQEQIQTDERRDREFCKELDRPVLEFIKCLKEDSEWSELGDYYLALRLLNGFIDSDLDPSVLRECGLEMIMALTTIDNKFAYNLLEQLTLK